MSLEPGNQTDYFDALINQSFNLSVIWLTLLHLKSNACAELVICTTLSWRIWKSSTPPVSIKSLFRTASENPINLIHKHVMQGKSPLTKQTLQLLAKMSLVFLCMIKLLLAVPFYTRGHMFGALPDGLQRDLCPPLRTELVIVGLLGERVKRQILQRSPTTISHDPVLL